MDKLQGGNELGLKLDQWEQQADALHLLISCLIYTSSTAEGSRESRTVKVHVRHVGHMWQWCELTGVSLAVSHTSALTDLSWFVSTSLCAVVGAATSGQQLGLQALDLTVFGGQELLQIRDFRLWMKTKWMTVTQAGLPRHRISQTHTCLRQRSKLFS